MAAAGPRIRARCRSTGRSNARAEAVGLQVYHSKRKFEATPEPRGRTVRSKGNQFVIQKHAARRLHYDLRLELDGVMKSWAVTRGPSLVAGEKRLAVQVEDHPIEYNEFEGTIPQGQYGGGTVMIWALGRHRPLDPGNRGRQGPCPRVAIEPQRQAKCQSGCDARQRCCDAAG